MFNERKYKIGDLVGKYEVIDFEGNYCDNDTYEKNHHLVFVEYAYIIQDQKGNKYKIFEERLDSIK